MAAKDDMPDDATPRGSLPPTTIGPYTVVREIGRGGMGRVFEATDTDGVRVAVKIIHPHLVGTSTYAERFLREAEAGRRVAHPGIVRVLDMGTTRIAGEDAPYLALEHVEGQSLRQLLDEVGSVPERLCRVIGARVADALAALHGADVIHRDVKPGNIVITADETVKLMDLGVALLQEESQRLSKTGEFVGSYLYAAPEQVRGETPGPTADLYALGLVLYELLTGNHPNKERDSEHMHGRVLDTGAPSPGASTHVSAFIDRVVTTLLARDPAERFESAEVLAEVLRDGEDSTWWRRVSADTPVVVRAHRPYERWVPIQGRDDELGRLMNAFSRLYVGKGATFVIEGEAGIGKTRLVNEWLDNVEGANEPPHVLVAAYSPGESTLAVPPLADALYEYLGDEDLEGRLARYLGASARLAPGLARHLRGVAGEREAPAATMLTAYQLVLRGLAREKPLVLVLEDLHFGGETARDMLIGFARSLESEPAMIVGTTRPGVPHAFQHGVEALARSQWIALSGLDTGASQAVIRGALGERASTSGGAMELIRTSDGNPFCLLEFARELLARHDTDDAESADTWFEDLEIPTSVRNLIDGRLDGLTEAERDLLSAAACCGTRFDPLLVCDMLEVPRIRGLKGFLALDRVHGLISTDGEAYRFRHHLVQEALYDDLSPPLRQTYHAALGHALARLKAPRDERPGRTAFELSRHFLLGNDPESAFPHLEAGLDYLLRMGELGRAGALAERMLALGDDLPKTLKVAALRQLGETRMARGPTREGLDALKEAWALAADEAVDVRADVAVSLGMSLRHHGEIDESLTMHRIGVELAEQTGDAALVSEAYGRMSMALSASGRVRKAHAAATEALKNAEAAHDTALEVVSARQLGIVESDLGNLERAHELLERAIALAHGSGERLGEIDASIVFTKVLRAEGDFDAVLDVLSRMRDACRETGHVRMEAVAVANHGHTLLDLGRFEEGVEDLDHALEIGRALEHLDMECHTHTLRGVGVFRLGRFSEAEDELRRGLAAAEKMQSPGASAMVRAPLIALLAWSGRFDEAETRIFEARAFLASIAAAVEGSSLSAAEAQFHEARGEYADAVRVLERALARDVSPSEVFFKVRLLVGLARCLIWMGDLDRARVALDDLLETLENVPATGFLASARILRGALPDTEVLPARVAMEEHGDRIAAHERILAAYAAGRARDDDVLLERARADLEALIAGAPEEHRDAMRAVPLYASILT